MAYQGEEIMMMNTNPALFAVVMVILSGLMAGVCVGLFIGFLLKRQKPAWADMPRTDKAINVTLVIVCSVIAIGGLAYRFLWM
jgi:NhaP-type Na+/H+ or K+/H+ antiporter